MDLARWLGHLKRHWTKLAAAAGFLVGIVGTFVVAPPFEAADEAIWRGMAQFSAAAMVGLVFAAVRFNAPRKRFHWAGVAGVVFVMASVVFVAYQHIVGLRSCIYNGQRVVIGTQYTPHGDSYVRQHDGITCEMLIADHAGAIEELWTRESIVASRSLLGGAYLVTFALFAMAILSVLEAIRLPPSRRRGRQSQGG